MLLFKIIYGEGMAPQLQYSCLENPMDGGAWKAAVHGVAESQTWLSDFTFIFHFHALEKEMAMHSSVLAWRIPGTGEPGGLPSMGSHRIGHDWSDLAAAWWTYLIKDDSFRHLDFGDDSVLNVNVGLPRWLSGKELACQHRRFRFDPWIKNIP